MDLAKKVPGAGPWKGKQMEIGHMGHSTQRSGSGHSSLWILIKSSHRTFFILKIFIYLFWLCWVFFVAHGLSSCGAQAWLLQDIWDLSSRIRNQTCVPCTARQVLNHWITGETPHTDLCKTFNCGKKKKKEFSGARTVLMGHSRWPWRSRKATLRTWNLKHGIP